MANELRITLKEFPGLTLLAKVYKANGTQQGSTVNMTEPTAGIYRGDFALGALANDAYSLSFETDIFAYGIGVLSVKDGAEVNFATINNFDPATDTVVNVTNVATTTTNTDMRGTDDALKAIDYVVPDNATIAAIKSDTTAIIADIVDVEANIALVNIQATLARKHLTNRDKIDEILNTLTRYDDDGTTPIETFDLKDVDGNAANTNIYEKVPQ